MKLLDGLVTLLAFYSRLPVPAPHHGMRLPREVGLLPIATLVIAAPAVLALLAATALGLPDRAAALVATLVLIAVTGALHEDGLADCADGFWGGADADRRLAIMRDSRLGTFGALALLSAVLLKAEVLAGLLAFGPITASAGLLAAAVAGRTLALYPWVGLPPARPDGLAASFGRPSAGAFRVALALGAAVTALLTLWLSPLGFALAALAALAVALGSARLADAKIGGHTGDVVGACVVLCDLSYLTAFTMCLAS